MTKKVRAVLIGCGGMGRHHIRQMLKQTDTTEISVICDISPQQYELAARLFKMRG